MRGKSWDDKARAWDDTALGLRSEDEFSQEARMLIETETGSMYGKLVSEEGLVIADSSNDGTDWSPEIIVSAVGVGG